MVLDTFSHPFAVTTIVFAPSIKLNVADNVPFDTLYVGLTEFPFKVTVTFDASSIFVIVPDNA